MSIDNLRKRLEEKNKQSADTATIYSKFSKPHRLMKTLNNIEREFDEMDSVQPVDEKIFQSINKFYLYGKDRLTKRDWKNLAWSLSKKLPEQQNKVLFTNIGQQLVDQFEFLTADQIKIIYFPLLYSYFAVEQQEIDKNPTTWLKLRNFLNNYRSMLFQTLNRPKSWLVTLTDYPELLSPQPTKNFVHDFLNTFDKDKVNKKLESLRIAHNSWFWNNLVSNTVSLVKDMNDDEFYKMIPQFLILLGNNRLYTTLILSALLERYAISSQRHIAHEVLKQLALNQWGNPQYESVAGWSNVNKETKKMVIQWFVRVDLEAFFNLFSRTADINRFNYWIKFIDKISFSQVFLGPMALNSHQSDLKKFIEENKSRLKHLTVSTNSNNAFMLKIDNVYVIDFSDTGNACYIVNKIPYPQGAKRILVNELKPNIYLKRLSHSGAWQSRFDQELAELGIFSKI